MADRYLCGQRQPVINAAPMNLWANYSDVNKVFMSDDVAYFVTMWNIEVHCKSQLRNGISHLTLGLYYSFSRIIIATLDEWLIRLSSLLAQ
jgi:hypothetical protein